jgi:hypothetical protein
MEKGDTNQISQTGINYYVLVLMFIGIIVYEIMNDYEPQIESQADIFEVIFYISQFLVGILGLFVAKKYWGSKVFGKAYLALGIGFILAGAGSVLFVGLEINDIVNPFPGLPDILIGPYFLLLLFHLFSCTRFFKKRFSKNDKLIIVLIPLSTTIVFILASNIPVEIPGSTPDLLAKYVMIGNNFFKLVEVNETSGNNQHVTVDGIMYELIPAKVTTTRYEQIPTTDFPIKFIPIVLTNITIGKTQEQDSSYWFGYGLTIYYIFTTSLNLGFAVVGAKIFQHTILGQAWGLLTIGIGLIAIGDIIYYFHALYSYDKTLDLPFWVFGHFIVAYALYVHKKNL